jgi:hypothetical protein
MDDKKPSRKQLDAELDEALKETFPASDPIAVGDVSGEEADRPVHRKPAKLDTALVEELARNVGAKHEK